MTATSSTTIAPLPFSKEAFDLLNRLREVKGIDPKSEEYGRICSEAEHLAIRRAGRRIAIGDVQLAYRSYDQRRREARESLWAQERSVELSHQLQEQIGPVFCSTVEQRDRRALVWLSRWSVPAGYKLDVQQFTADGLWIQLVTTN